MPHPGTAIIGLISSLPIVEAAEFRSLASARKETGPGTGGRRRKSG